MVRGLSIDEAVSQIRVRRPIPGLPVPYIGPPPILPLISEQERKRQEQDHRLPLHLPEDSPMPEYDPDMPRHDPSPVKDGEYQLSYR